MKARFFYGAPIFSNSPKLFVLTEDGILYSQVSEYNTTKIEQTEHLSFSNFSIRDFESEDYPTFLEIDFKKACDIPLTNQVNWINRYILSKSKTSETAAY